MEPLNFIQTSSCLCLGTYSDHQNVGWSFSLTGTFSKEIVWAGPFVSLLEIPIAVFAANYCLRSSASFTLTVTASFSSSKGGVRTTCFLVLIRWSEGSLPWHESDQPKRGSAWTNSNWFFVLAVPFVCWLVVEGLGCPHLHGALYC